MELKLIINQDRTVILSEIEKQGNVKENSATSLEITCPEELKNYTKTIEFETDDGTVFDAIFDNKYVFKNNITKYENVVAQIVFDDSTNNKRWKSDIFELNFGKSINAEHNIDDEEIEHTVIDTILDEINKTKNDLSENYYDKEESDTLLFNKVDKVEGHSLVDDEEIARLANVDNYNDTEITNRVGSLETDNVTNKANIQSNTEAIETKVDKVEGKGLSPEEFTFQEKNKLRNIESGAQANVIENIKVNGTSQEINNKSVDIPVPTKVSDLNNDSEFVDKNVNNLTNYYKKSETYTKTEIDNKIASVYKYKGSVATYDNLPSTDLTEGDVYDVKDTGKNYAWNGTVWDDLSGIVDLSDYYTKLQVDSALGNKQNKITGSNKLNADFVDDSNSTNKFVTQTQKDKLDGIAAGAQVNVLENLTLDGQTLQKNNKAIEIKDPEVTNARQSTTKNKTFDNVDARIEELEEDVQNIEKTRGHTYGIRRKITNNSSSAWERIYDSIGKVANATKNGGTVVNSFDDLAPWADIKSCNYDLITKKINAWYGDANYKTDGTNGDVQTHYPETYWKIYQKDDYDYVELADYARTGFIKIDGFFIGRHEGSVVDGILRSYSGLIPTTSMTIGAFRTLARALGDEFSLLDWRYLVIQLLYLVEYANYNSQAMLGNGIQSRRLLQTLVAETNTNRAIVSNSSGYFVGQIIRIGTSDGGTQVANEREITSIESYNDGTVTGYALTFDGAAVNIAVGNYVCTMAQRTGQCDSLGMKSGCLNNDGYHSMIYRGVENIFGNVWKWVDGINIKDRIAYICKDHSEYVSDKFEDPYKALSYVNADANGWAKTLGFDPDEPFFRFPTEVGGSSSTYMDDYYYQNTGNRVALVGGAFTFGAGVGLWYWYFGSASSFANWSIGCRVLIDDQ